ncbi:Pentatricopeptide repeat-containing protein [Thalictrum thalictroides]|uniref:Pentatricopeptide repeat-containing protein n=1 Tax=Thalictrum thalictroides TaxID=46969 RepID=A0A7J6VGV9_THATH|nr:Pentatricopeptide repeat-containing protein [Thalictrum thalictroides]
MMCSEVRPQSATFSGIFPIFSGLGCLNMAKRIHGLAIAFGCGYGKYCGTSLIDMYANCSGLGYGRLIFDRVRGRDVVSWNIMLKGNVQLGLIDEVMELFNGMLMNGIVPNKITLECITHLYLQNRGVLDLIHNLEYMGLASSIVSANLLDHMCEHIDDIKQAKELHMYNSVVAALIRMSSKFSYTEAAQEVFKSLNVKDLNCWNAMLTTGKQLHCTFLRNEGEMSKFVCTAFINMYGNCGDVAYAVNLFESMDRVAGNIITWTTMVSSYAHNGLVDESLKHFRELQLEGLRPNSITIASILPACAQAVTLSHGKSIYGYIVRNGLDDEDLMVPNALVDMHFKCGCLKDLQCMGMPKLHLPCLIPDHVTFIGVLNACSHAGLVNKGWKQFNSMEFRYGIIPSGEHYACMVDILRRGGHFKDARDFIVQMPLQPTTSLWGALLSACKTHGNVEMAEYAGKCLIDKEESRPISFVS